MRGARGPAAFVALAIALTWLSAAWLGAGATDDGPATTRLLRASLIYAAVVGWQPLVALALARRWFGDDRELDHGVAHGAPRFWTISIAWPVALLVAAAAIALAGDAPAATTAVAAPRGSWSEAGSAIACFVAAVGVLWLQAIGEELAWRGYLMTRLMRRLGAWPGVVLHGVLWGLWYAPILLVVGPGASVARLAGFVVTCALLGIVLGWLRLASRSIYVSAASNATLTLCGGLPLAIQGISSPLTAIYEPAGWLPIALSIALIAARSSLRAAIAVPYRRIPEHVN